MRQISESQVPFKICACTEQKDDIYEGSTHLSYERLNFTIGDKRAIQTTSHKNMVRKIVVNNLKCKNELLKNPSSFEFLLILKHNEE